MSDLTDRLPPELLRKLLRYEPDTGLLFWRERPLSMFKDGTQSANHRCNNWNSIYSGKEAITAQKDGYRQGTVCRTTVRGHRVAWAVFYGEWPDGQIDHINQVRSDNRLSNLRVVSGAENNKNSLIRSNNKSGFNGVSWRPSRNKWIARVRVDGIGIHLGNFSNKDDAILARKEANKKYGFHRNHGRENNG